MATFHLRRFSSPAILRAVAPDRLLTFLEPYRDFLHQRGVYLPDPISGERPEYDSLVALFLSPDTGMPKPLFDALYYVDEMATPEGMDDLIDAAKEAGIPLDPRDDDTPADVAVQVWLQAPHILERKHAEHFVSKRRSFEYFQTDAPDLRPFQFPDAATLAALEDSLNTWFVQRKRGRTARVFLFDKEGSIWFLVRRGEPFKREESAAGTEATSVSYRPLKYDVLVYESAYGELRINAESKGAKELYRTLFGKYLFGRADYFPNATKYTLGPLQSDGEVSLNCLDVDGIDWARLREVHLLWGGPHGEMEIRRATNLFAALHSRSRTLPSARLLRAVFQVKFTDAKRPRSVTIKPPNVAIYGRDGDSSYVEAWLRQRGFLDVYGAADRDAPDPVLARS